MANERDAVPVMGVKYRFHWMSSNQMISGLVKSRVMGDDQTIQSLDWRLGVKIPRVEWDQT